MVWLKPVHLIHQIGKLEVDMAKGVQHYFKDGRKHNGGTHKMPDGSVHSGKTHTKGSKTVVHFKDLTKAAKERARRT